jgi:transposase
MSVEAAASGAVFHAYLEQVLLPELRRRKPDAVLVMDNLGAHKTPEVRELLDGSGFPYRYLPSYSPDLSPIEPAWAQVKAELRRVAARDEDALHRALGPALDRVPAANAAARFRRCGYDRPG